MTTQRLFVAGSLPMSRSEAQDLIDRGHKVVLHLWGEGPYAATITAGETGLEYEKELLLLGDAPAGEPPLDAYLIES